MDGPADPTVATMTVRVPAPMPGVATLSPVGASAAPFVRVPRFAFGAEQHYSPPPPPILRV